MQALSVEDEPAASLVYFRSGEQLAPITELAHLRLQASSGGEGWRGLHLELGSADRWDGEDLSVAGHFVSMNVTEAPLQVWMRRIEDGTWDACWLEPGAFWIVPEGCPFSLRVEGRTTWSGAIVDGVALDQAMGGHVEIEAGANVKAPILEHLFRALIEDLRGGGVQPPLTQALVGGFLIALGVARGRMRQLAAGTTLTPAQLAQIDAWVLANIHARLTVDDLARLVGLSPSLFARAYRRAAGFAPWERVIQLRTERAQALLSGGLSVCATATECGFFDQAHLARVFRQRLKTSPSQFARRSQSAPSVQTR